MAAAAAGNRRCDGRREGLREREKETDRKRERESARDERERYDGSCRQCVFRFDKGPAGAADSARRRLIRRHQSAAEESAALISVNVILLRAVREYIAPSGKGACRSSSSAYTVRRVVAARPSPPPPPPPPRPSRLSLSSPRPSSPSTRTTTAASYNSVRECRRRHCCCAPRCFSLGVCRFLRVRR